MAYFRCSSGSVGGGATITVSYTSDFYNKTITCSDGTTTYTKTTTSSGSTEFAVKDEGTWTITCNGVSRTVDVVLNYTTEMAITQTVTIYSAASDTVSFTDVNGSKTCTTDSSGEGSVSITYLPNQSITFTSSVGKDPDNLSNNYTKTVTLTNAVTEVYVMPDNALYWYGYNGGIENCNSTNGWSNGTTGTVTFETNDIYLAVPTSGQTAVIGASDKHSTDKYHVIFHMKDLTTGGLRDRTNIYTKVTSTKNVNESSPLYSSRNLYTGSSVYPTEDTCTREEDLGSSLNGYYLIQLNAVFGYAMYLYAVIAG